MFHLMSVKPHKRLFHGLLLSLMAIAGFSACKPEAGIITLPMPRHERDQKLPHDEGAGVIAQRDTTFYGSGTSCRIKALERFRITSAREVTGSTAPSPNAQQSLEINLLFAIPGCATGMTVTASAADVVIENIEIEGGREPSPEEKKENQFKVLLNFQFPIDRLPKLDYTKDGRGFGARREGNRLHAANDLIGVKNQDVVATASGTIKDYYEFYCGSFAIVIDHGSYTALYGEVASLTTGLKIGSKVAKGQKIAKLAELCEGSSMLHFEKYVGTEKGPLTVRTNLPFQRRKDLVSPTSFLKSLEITAQK